MFWEDMNIKLHHIFFIIGALIISYCIPIFFKLGALHSWPNTIGRITQSRIVSVQYGRGYDYKYKPVINYKYYVQGRYYDSNNISIEDISYNETTIPQHLIDKYPINQKVTIYYNPLDPQDSILEFDSKGIFYRLSFGILLIIIGLFFKRKNLE